LKRGRKRKSAYQDVGLEPFLFPSEGKNSHKQKEEKKDFPRMADLVILHPPEGRDFLRAAPEVLITKDTCPEERGVSARGRTPPYPPRRSASTKKEPQSTNRIEISTD